MSVSDEELLSDLRVVAAELGKDTIGMREYRQFGKYDDTTTSRRFGSWNKALLAAGLSLSNEVDISDQRLFENLLALWQHYGRQPRRSELAREPSTVSQTPYSRRFGSWSGALSAFVEFANRTEPEIEALASTEVSAKITGRDPSLRLRWRVLRHDNFRCRACGASPAIDPSVELHVDHIVAWSKGGETAFENLQTLCDKCNLGKADGEMFAPTVGPA